MKKMMDIGMMKKMKKTKKTKKNEQTRGGENLPHYFMLTEKINF